MREYNLNSTTLRPKRMSSVFESKVLGFRSIKKSAKILLVDDEDYNLTALKIILKYHIRLDIENLCDEAANG